VARYLSAADSPELATLTSGDDLPILMVDDRPANLHALASVLEPLGVPLEHAGSGEEALRCLLERDYSLILLDVRMPGLDGLQTAQLIKRRPRSADVPILFLTAAQDDPGVIARGYGIGAVDYVQKPFAPELLRSKVAVFLELERGRRALQRSEAFLRAAFEGAPIGKTVVDRQWRIVRANAAFGRLLEREAGDLAGAEVLSLCHPDDRDRLGEALEEICVSLAPVPSAGLEVDMRLRSAAGAEVWAAAVASRVSTGEREEPLLLIQWVDLSARRRAEQSRADLMLEHSARTQAEAIAERLNKLQMLSAALDSLQLDEIVQELALRLAELFDVKATEVTMTGEAEGSILVRAEHGRIVAGRTAATDPAAPLPEGGWEEHAVVVDRLEAGQLRLWLPPQRSLSATERSLLSDVAERAALAIRRARLHEQEHRIAVQLQAGLVPKQLPELDGITVAAFLQAAGAGAQVGGDWYDVFALDRGRLGVVVGDVAGRGIPAASAMGQLRSVTRAFALADDGAHSPAEVLTRLNHHQLALGADDMFTAIYVVLDPLRGRLTWANAGHLPPVVRTGSGEVKLLPGGNGVLGIDPVTCQDLSVEVSAPATLVLYTDGLVERRGESLDVGLARLTDAVSSGPEVPQELCQHVLNRLLEDAQDQHDDVTAVVVKLG